MSAADLGKLSPGKTIRVTANDGEVFEGVFQTFDEAMGLEILVGEQLKRIATSRIANVRRKQTRAGQLALTGTIVLGFGMASYCSTQCAGFPDSHDPSPSEMSAFFFAGLVIGTVIGSVMGAIVGVFMTRWKVVYEATARSI